MTHEQMVAWLILEGWEYHPDDGDTAPHIIRNRRMLSETYIRCAGQMIVYYDGEANCFTDGTSATINYDGAFNGATQLEVESFYTALNDPDKHWSHR